MKTNINPTITLNAPQEEPARQFYFAELCREIIKKAEQEKGAPLTACVNTFGCQMNAKDSEKLRGILVRCGYEISDSDDSDFVLYNTCTVRENANVRVYGRLGVLKGTKKNNRHMIIALCGCMMQEPQVVEKIRQSYRHVDIIFGTHNIYKLAELLYRRLTEQSMQVEVLDAPEQTVENLPSERKFSFKCGVNIMYGCDNFCSYCIVPYVRGRERSRLPEDILDEVRQAVSEGVKEIMLLGQNVNSYGRKYIGGAESDVTFPQLLQAVSQVPGVLRVRFMTSHPKDLSDELIAVIRDNPGICRHVHLPLQSGSDRLLKEMNRHYTKAQYLALTEKIRREIPGVSITTDIIVGFPGETEEDFLETLDVVKKVRFDSAFTFIYSRRTGTRAAEMPDQVPKEIVDERFSRLLETVNVGASEQNRLLEGTVQEVLAEEVNSRDARLLTGRLSNNSVVHFPGDASLIGSLVQVRLDEAKGFYYNGSLTDDVSVSGDKKTI